MHGQELKASLLFQEYNESICLKIFQDVYQECKVDVKKGNSMEKFGEKTADNIVTDAIIHYSQWIEIRKKLYPVANNLSSDICEYICKLVDFSSTISQQIMQSALQNVPSKSRRKSKQSVLHWANSLTDNILNDSKLALRDATDLKFHKLTSKMTMGEKLDKWASSFATEVMSKSREDIRSGCLSDHDETLSTDSWMSSRRKSGSKAWNSNNSNNCDSHKSNIEEFASQLVQRLLPCQSLPSTSVTINCDTRVTCADSCDSLMSSHTTPTR